MERGSFPSNFLGEIFATNVIRGSKRLIWKIAPWVRVCVSLGRCITVEYLFQKPPFQKILLSVRKRHSPMNFTIFQKMHIDSNLFRCSLNFSNRTSQRTGFGGLLSEISPIWFEICVWYKYVWTNAFNPCSSIQSEQSECILMLFRFQNFILR